MGLEELRDNKIVDKLVELDRKYNFTDMILGFLLGFSVTLLIVYTHPEWFEITVERGYEGGFRRGVENFENLGKDNLKEVLEVVR